MLKQHLQASVTSSTQMQQQLELKQAELERVSQHAEALSQQVDAAVTGKAQMQRQLLGAQAKLERACKHVEAVELRLAAFATAQDQATQVWRWRCSKVPLCKGLQSQIKTTCDTS